MQNIPNNLREAIDSFEKSREAESINDEQILTSFYNESKSLQKTKYISLVKNNVFENGMNFEQKILETHNNLYIHLMHEFIKLFDDLVILSENEIKQFLVKPFVESRIFSIDKKEDKNNITNINFILNKAPYKICDKVYNGNDIQRIIDDVYENGYINLLFNGNQYTIAFKQYNLNKLALFRDLLASSYVFNQNEEQNFILRMNTDKRFVRQTTYLKCAKCGTDQKISNSLVNEYLKTESLTKTHEKILFTCSTCEETYDLAIIKKVN